MLTGCLPDIKRGSELRRGGDKSMVDQYICLIFMQKRKKFNLERIKFLFRSIHRSKKILKFTKPIKLQFFKLMVKNRVVIFEKEQTLLNKFIGHFQYGLGNLIHSSSFITERMDKNRIHRPWFLKKLVQSKKRKSHYEVLNLIKGVEYKRGQIICGNRGYFLKGPGLLLNLSLVRFGIDFLSSKSFVNLQPPYFMNGSVLKKCAQLEDFLEQLYCLGADEGKFLIATSEQPLSAFHTKEVIEAKLLPLKYSGFSSCFRKECGSHGKDTNGIFRVHQFDKVEQFGIQNPFSLGSWNLFEEFSRNVVDFYSALEIPLIKLDIGSHSLNKSASKKTDFMGWYPVSLCFREIVSCSNCTDFQTQKLEIRVKSLENPKKLQNAHLVNSTLCATTRVICSILENFQTDFGVIIPKILRNYIGVSFLPF